MSTRSIELRLVGRTLLLGADGGDITPRGAKTQGLLVLLGSARNYRRSRAYLQDKLWSDRGPEQGAASLRQALAELRRSLGECRDCLITEAHMVGFDPSRVRVVIEPERGDWGPLGEEPEFAEGLDILDPEFEDWIRDQRIAFAERCKLRPGSDDGGAAEVRPEAGGPESVTEASIAQPSGAPAVWRALRRRPGLIAAALLVFLLLLFGTGLLLPPRLDGVGTLAGPPAAAAARNSIAILPFEAPDARPGQLGFVKAVSREIATDLAQNSELVVIDADASLQNISARGAMPTAALGVGRELGVRYVLRGYIQLIEGRGRTIVQLIDASSGQTTWATKYDTDAGRLLAMQETVVSGVVDSLEAILIPVCGSAVPATDC